MPERSPDCPLPGDLRVAPGDLHLLRKLVAGRVVAAGQGPAMTQVMNTADIEEWKR
ncbi:hypothetical protein GCM10009759_77210 [Kitasatospora saccharophila]|uniref:Uncharacterized protein n=1 Tax=Kitasatospora saccharophila TaxID=407973 RepID=A0ABP5K1R4_9ACTN